MLTYEIHLIICDDIHDIDLDCKCFRIIPKDLLILILFHKNKRLICYTYFLYDNFAKFSLHNCNESIYVKHSESSLYKCYNVNSL